MALLSEDARSAKAQVQDLDPEEKKVVVRELNESIFPKSDWQRTILWAILIIGLIAIAIIAIFVGAAEDDADAYIAITTLVVGGVIGLFSKSPVSSGD